jgi:PhzF family phenazine biosynthesis protein
MRLEYRHVDVFTRQPYAGNSLPVFLDARGLSAREMLQITRELRHFEAIFLEPTDDPSVVRARVFDLFEELPFAGHPVIGAAAALHHATESSTAAGASSCRKTVTVATERTPTATSGCSTRGAGFLGGVDREEWVAPAFGLAPEDLHAQLPLEVISQRGCAT